MPTVIYEFKNFFSKIIIIFNYPKSSKMINYWDNLFIYWMFSSYLILNNSCSWRNMLVLAHLTQVAPTTKNAPVSGGYSGVFDLR